MQGGAIVSLDGTKVTKQIRHIPELGARPAPPRVPLALQTLTDSVHGSRAALSFAPHFGWGKESWG